MLALWALLLAACSVTIESGMHGEYDAEHPTASASPTPSL
jgi:uncharacterized protein YfiM (DUF2279 family)